MVGFLVPGINWMGDFIHPISPHVSLYKVFRGVCFPLHKPYPYSLYRFEYLHLRYLKYEFIVDRVEDESRDVCFITIDPMTTPPSKRDTPPKSLSSYISSPASSLKMFRDGWMAWKHLVTAHMANVWPKKAKGSWSGLETTKRPCISAWNRNKTTLGVWNGCTLNLKFFNY